MSTNQGIPDNFPTPPVIRPNTLPAAVAGTAVPPVTTSPFTTVGGAESLPTGVGTNEDFRKAKSPFQVAEPPVSFGFEASTKALAAVPSASSQSAPAKVAAVPAPTVAFGDLQTDSFSIRQLELRAIFGVDREMTESEIYERCRALPGIQNIARVNAQDMGTIDALKGLMSNLGFGSGGLRLYAGPAPVEFIREGSVLLAVRADGGFAPGVRETLMLVAREFGRPV